MPTLRASGNRWKEKNGEASGIDSLEKKAHFYAYEVMDDVLSGTRQICDKIEEFVDDQFWPLPKYREMLFVF